MNTEVKEMTFADKWHAEKLLKRAKKKAKKTLQAKGVSKSDATKLVKGAVNNIANRPMKRAAGRGG
jgi:DNA-binding Xre family transcriptional regulator